MFGLFKIWVAPKDGIKKTLGWRQCGGNHDLFYNGTHWKIESWGTGELGGENGLASNCNKSIFPPKNWSVWNGKKWISDDKVKIVTGDEVTKYKFCNKVMISFDKKHKDFSKIPKEHLGTYTLMKDSCSYGRPKYQNENMKIQLGVISDGQWATTDGELRSAAAGDMNPASERNSQCKGCNVPSWSFYNGTNGEKIGGIQSDKLKVSCEENIDEDVSDDWHEIEESEKENNGNHTEMGFPFHHPIMGITTEDYNEVDMDIKV